MIIWALVGLVIVWALSSLANVILIDQDAGESDFVQSAAIAVSANVLVLASLAAGGVMLLVLLGDREDLSARWELILAGSALGLLTLLGVISLLSTLSIDVSSDLVRVEGVVGFLAALAVSASVTIAMFGLVLGGETAREPRSASAPPTRPMPGGYGGPYATPYGYQYGEQQYQASQYGGLGSPGDQGQGDYQQGRGGPPYLGQPISPYAWTEQVPPGSEYARHYGAGQHGQTYTEPEYGHDYEPGPSSTRYEPTQYAPPYGSYAGAARAGTGGPASTAAPQNSSSRGETGEPSADSTGEPRPPSTDEQPPETRPPAS